MQISYEILFNITFSHQYFISNSCISLKPTLSKEAKKNIYKYGLIFKPHPSGFIVLFETFFAGRERTRKEMLEMSFTLRFFLENSDPHFCTYTNNLRKYNPSCSILYFSNGKNSDRLHNAEFVDIALDQCNTKEIAITDRLINLFSIIDIDIQNIGTVAYFIRFEAKETYWRYALTTQHLLELDSPAIVNKADKSFFEGPVSCLMPDGKKALLFTSRHPLLWSEQPNRDLQLVENYNSGTGKYKVVVSRLPNPDITNMSVITTNRDAVEQVTYAEIII